MAVDRYAAMPRYVVADHFAEADRYAVADHCAAADRYAGVDHYAAVVHCVVVVHCAVVDRYGAVVHTSTAAQPSAMEHRVGRGVQAFPLSRVRPEAGFAQAWPENRLRIRHHSHEA